MGNGRKCATVQTVACNRPGTRARENGRQQYRPLHAIGREQDQENTTSKMYRPDNNKPVGFKFKAPI
jgi:hypothetical protein